MCEALGAVASHGSAGHSADTSWNQNRGRWHLTSRWNYCSSLLLPGGNKNWDNNRFCWSLWRGRCTGEVAWLVEVFFQRPKLFWGELCNLMPFLCTWAAPWPIWLPAKIKQLPFNTAFLPGSWLLFQWRVTLVTESGTAPSPSGFWWFPIKCPQ